MLKRTFIHYIPVRNCSPTPAQPVHNNAALSATPGAAGARCPTAGTPSLMPKVISIQMDFTCCQKFNRNAGIP